MSSFSMFGTNIWGCAVHMVPKWCTMVPNCVHNDPRSPGAPLLLDLIVLSLFYVCLKLDVTQLFLDNFDSLFPYLPDPLLPPIPQVAHFSTWSWLSVRWWPCNRPYTTHDACSIPRNNWKIQDTVPNWVSHQPVHCTPSNVKWSPTEVSATQDNALKEQLALRFLQ